MAEVLLKPLQRFNRLILVDTRILIKLYVYAIFLGGLNLTLPLGVQAIIGLISSGRITTTWIVLILFIVVGIVFYGLANLMQMYLLETLQQRIFTRAALEFAFRIPRMKLDYLSKYYPPELINRFFDIMTIQKGLSKILMDFSTSILQILFGLTLLGFYHSIFAVFSFFLLLILFLIIYFTGPLGMESSIKESKYKYEVVFWLEEIARALETFKLAGNTELTTDKADQFTLKYLEYRTKHFKIIALQYSTIILFKMLITAGLLILGSYLVINKEINVAQFVASEIVIILVMSSTEKLISSMETIYDVFTAIDKVGYVTDIPIENQEGINFSNMDTDKGMKVTTNNISYRHQESTHYAIKNINLEILPNQKVCISGFSGSGKTTLITILAGIVEQYEGGLSYNDVPFLNLNRRSLRSYIGDTLTQDTVFKGTIEENIMLSKSHIDSDTLRWACDAVGITDFIKKLPEGFQTNLMPDDKRFPKSFLRKIVIARAIAEKPKLIVMDDLLHGFEQEELNHIINTLFHPNAPWTLVIVSKKASIAQHADRIIILNDGMIMDDDTYQNIQNKPYFHQIFND